MDDDNQTTYVAYYWTLAFNAMKDVSTDIILRTSTGDVHAHKLLLMTTSDYFKGYFTQHPDIKIVQLDDELMIVQAYVDSFYTGNVEEFNSLTYIKLPIEYTFKLYDFIDYYQIHVHCFSLVWREHFNLSDEEYGELYQRMYRMLEYSNIKLYNKDWYNRFVYHIMEGPKFPIIGPNDNNWDWLLKKTPTYNRFREYYPWDKFHDWMKSDAVSHPDFVKRWKEK